VIRDASVAVLAHAWPVAARATGHATFERLRRTRHTAQYFDPAAAPITKSDASWAIEKATAALSNVKALLAGSPPERFN